MNAASNTIRTTHSSVEFIRAKNESLFCITTQPQQNQQCDSTVIIVAPFAEELNRSRRFLCMLRQHLAARHMVVVQPDLFGTGDSTGDFADSTLSIWLEDLIKVRDLMRDRFPGKVTLLGIRSGCLLIEEFIRQAHHSQDAQTIDSLVYLQPEINGSDVIQQLLRARVAAKRFAGDKSETVESLWRDFNADRTIRVAGYPISSALALSMQKLSIDPLKKPLLNHACWVDLDEMSMQPKLHEKWHTNTVVTRPFWQLHECEIEPEKLRLIANHIEDVIRH